MFAVLLHIAFYMFLGLHLSIDVGGQPTYAPPIALKRHVRSQHDAVQASPSCIIL